MEAKILNPFRNPWPTCSGIRTLIAQLCGGLCLCWHRSRYFRYVHCDCVDLIFPSITDPIWWKETRGIVMRHHSNCIASSRRMHAVSCPVSGAHWNAVSIKFANKICEAMISVLKMPDQHMTPNWIVRLAPDFYLDSGICIIRLFSADTHSIFWSSRCQFGLTYSNPFMTIKWPCSFRLH